MRRPREVNIVIGLGIFSFVAIFLYWLAWYAWPGLVQSRSPSDTDYQIYVAYEQAFPLADGWLAIGQETSPRTNRRCLLYT